MGELKSKNQKIKKQLVLSIYNHRSLINQGLSLWEIQGWHHIFIGYILNWFTWDGV